MRLMLSWQPRRSDFVPRLTYASVEGMFLELVDASPVRRRVRAVMTVPSNDGFSA